MAGERDQMRLAEKVPVRDKINQLVGCKMASQACAGNMSCCQQVNGRQVMKNKTFEYNGEHVQKS